MWRIHDVVQYKFVFNIGTNATIITSYVKSKFLLKVYPFTVNFFQVKAQISDKTAGTKNGILSIE